MSSSSARAQAEPVVALVCLAVLSATLAAYATAYGAALPPSDRDLAPPTLDAVADTLVVDGLARPDRLATAVPALDRTVNLTLTTRTRTWAVGPIPPSAADAATRPLPVALAPGTVRFARLRVTVW